jgi:ABC-type uncharacterized transport system ATPase component
MMVTNNLQFLSYADCVVVLKSGEMVAQMSKAEMTSSTLQERLESYGIKLAVHAPENE